MSNFINKLSQKFTISLQICPKIDQNSVKEKTKIQSTTFSYEKLLTFLKIDIFLFCVLLLIDINEFYA